MSITKLMERRFKCIRPFEEFSEGQIFTPENPSFFQALPAYFKELKWYEERDPNEKWASEEKPKKEVPKKEEPKIEIPVRKIETPMEFDEEPFFTPKQKAAEKAEEDYQKLRLDSVPSVYHTPRPRFTGSTGYVKKDKIIEQYADGTQSKPRFKKTGRKDVVAIFIVKRKKV